MMRIEKIDNGRAVVVYSILNQNEEKIFYGLQEYNGIRWMRMSSPFRAWGELIYEAEREVKLRNKIKVEIPRDDSSISKKVREFIDNNSQIEGF
jgi:hypothetical protein